MNYREIRAPKLEFPKFYTLTQLDLGDGSFIHTDCISKYTIIQAGCLEDALWRAYSLGIDTSSIRWELDREGHLSPTIKDKSLHQLLESEERTVQPEEITIHYINGYVIQGIR